MRLTSVLILLMMLSVGLNPAYGMQPSLTLTSPAPYQVFQRHGGVADITISGTVEAQGTIEARFNGGEWQSIGQIRSGAFSGVLVGQAQGQGGLEVRVSQARLAEAPEIATGVGLVGIGDVFVIAGQSNAGGYGYRLHTTTHEWLTGSLFGNDYRWQALNDPVDSDSGQVDAISLDWGTAGSVWPLVATHLMNARNIPVAFVPSAHSGSSIEEWLPGRNPFNRATLYGSMAHRARETGARAILWWQGESDALGGMSQTDYEAKLNELAGAIERDLGIPMIAALLHNSRDIGDQQEAAIRQAVVEAAGNGSIVLGPDLSDLTSDDQYHLLSDANVEAAAERWWQALSRIVE